MQNLRRIEQFPGGSRFIQKKEGILKMRNFTKLAGSLAMAGSALALSTAAYATPTALDAAMSSWNPVAIINEHGAKIVLLAIAMAAIFIVVKLVNRGK